MDAGSVASIAAHFPFPGNSSPWRPVLTGSTLAVNGVGQDGSHVHHARCRGTRLHPWQRSSRRGCSSAKHLFSGYLADNPTCLLRGSQRRPAFPEGGRGRHIANQDLDTAAISRFCSTPLPVCRAAYSAAQLRDPALITEVRRFLRYLADYGHVAIPDEVARLGPQFGRLFRVPCWPRGYGKVTLQLTLCQARHFAELGLQRRIPASHIDNDLIRAGAIITVSAGFQDQTRQAGRRNRHEDSPPWCARLRGFPQRGRD